MNRDKVIPAVYMILKKDDEYLLIRRFNTGYEDGKYSLVAGHIDKGETPVETAVRELKEEVGIKAKEEDVMVKHMMYCKNEGHDRIHCYVEINRWEGEVKNMEPDKCDELRWCKKENFPENLLIDVKQAIDAAENGDFYSEYIYH